MRLESHLHPGLDEHPLIATGPADADRIVETLLDLGEPRVAYLRDDDEMISATLAVDGDREVGILVISQPEPAYPGDPDPGDDDSLYVRFLDEYDPVLFPTSWILPLATIRAALRELLAGQLLPPAIAWRDGLGEAM